MLRDGPAIPKTKYADRSHKLWVPYTGNLFLAYLKRAFGGIHVVSYDSIFAHHNDDKYELCTVVY